MKSAYFLFIYFFIALSPTYSQPEAINKITGWVNNNCIPLKSVIAETGLQDLEPLDTVIGDARIVALGECTHGSSEIFSMKHRMLEYLVKEKGFTIFSIEANMPEAYALNKYIIQGEGDPKKLIAGMYFWTWNTQEVLNMVEWLKKYNNSTMNKISFTGFDMQIPFTSIKIVRNYLTAHSIPVNAINELDSLYLQNIRKHGYKNYKSRDIISLAHDILDALQKDLSLPKDSSYIWALQNSKLLYQYAFMVNEKVDRDESMAENVQWIADQNTNAKIVIWAHNGHVRKATKFSKPMGYYLDQKFGKQYLNIGFSTEEGTYTAVNKEKSSSLDSGNNLLPSSEKDIEHSFKASKYDNFILDLRKAKQDVQSNDWISDKFRMRDIGARVFDKYQFIDVHLDKDFDMLIFLKRTTSSKCFLLSKK